MRLLAYFWDYRKIVPWLVREITCQTHTVGRKVKRISSSDWEKHPFPCCKNIAHTLSRWVQNELHNGWLLWYQQSIAQELRSHLKSLTANEKNKKNFKCTHSEMARDHAAPLKKWNNEKHFTTESTTTKHSVGRAPNEWHKGLREQVLNASCGLFG